MNNSTMNNLHEDEQIKNEILDYLKERKSPSLEKKEFIHQIHLYLREKNLSYSTQEIEEIVHQMIASYLLHESRNHHIDLLSRAGLFIGKITIKERGFGFIQTQDMEEYYVAKEDTHSAMDQDKVLFRKLHSCVYEGKTEAVVIKVIERNLKQVVGKVIEQDGKKIFSPKDSSLKIHLEVTDFGLSVVDDIVLVKIDEYIHDDCALAHVQKIIGNQNDVGIDVSTIAIEYGFVQEFSQKVMEDVEEVTKDYLLHLDDEIKRRTHVKRKIITIDGSDAKDLDDAVSIEKLDNGNYLLGVYIADVSYFVKEDSPLDQEAYERGTSVYLTDRVIPMLPHKLSNDLCSLNEKTPKLVIACEMEIDHEGKVVSSNIFEGWIETLHRMTYDQVNLILEGHHDQKYQDIEQELYMMQELSHILNQMRYKRGSLEFNIPEAKIIVDEKGKPIDILLRTRKEGEKLIEEFMLIANETVATYITQMDLPMIYRIHDVPSSEKLKQFQRIIKNTNYSFKVHGNKVTPKSLQKLLEQVDFGLSTMLLRMMAKAKYSYENIGHYGLASSCYTHFTSPIRRYPDLIVHRLLRSYLFLGQVSVEDQMSRLQMIMNASVQSSKKERDAISCEYEVNDMKMAEYMENHIGEIFEGTISSITKFGMFVMLPNTIEGLVHISDLKDDYYQYYDQLMALIGVHSHKTYRIGDKVKVQVTHADRKKQEIDFIIAHQKNQNMMKYKKVSPKGRSHHEKRSKQGRSKK